MDQVNGGRGGWRSRLAGAFRPAAGPSPRDSATVLRDFLTARAGSVEALTASAAREHWLAFAAVPFRTPRRPEADGLLYQYGVYDFTGPERFHLSLTRQFALPDDDEFWQVELALLYDPRPELVALGRYDEWWFEDDDGPLAEWAERLRARPEWATFEGLRPLDVVVGGDTT